jgi:hypothetical protein
MPILEVEVNDNLNLGKFGSSFLDINIPPKNKKRLTFTTQVVDPFFSDDPLVCRPTLSKSENRPSFAIERGNIPQFNCDTPSAIEQEIEFLNGGRKNLDVDPFLTTDESLFEDISKTNFIADRQVTENDPNTIDLLVPVAGIAFSLWEGDSWNSRPASKPRIEFAFGLGNDQLNSTYNCSGNTKIQAPHLLTDVRNGQGFNLARDPWRAASSWGSWGGWNNRFYLEIRHGFNTKKYTADVQLNTASGEGLAGSGWSMILHKNSYILVRTRPLSTSSNGFWNHRGRYSQVLPKGRITVTFFGDPCDIRSSQNTGEGPGGGI